MVCRPPLELDRQRLLGAAGASTAPAALEELCISPPDDSCTEPLLGGAAAAPDAGRDGGLQRDISLPGAAAAAAGAHGQAAPVLRMPLYGHRGGAGLEELCDRELAPLLDGLLAGESCAVICYGQTGALCGA